MYTFAFRIYGSDDDWTLSKQRFTSASSAIDAMMAWVQLGWDNGLCIEVRLEETNDGARQ